MKDFIDIFALNKFILMEGALGERLKREYGINFDPDVVMAGLVYTNDGRNALKRIWIEYAEIAQKYKLPFIATTPTRRVNYSRICKSTFSDNIIKDNVEFLDSVRNSINCSFYIGGMLGCAGDAYTGNECLDRTNSENFHAWEIERFCRTKVDYLYAALIPTLEEAIGIAKACEKNDKPYIISFTINKNGCLTDGTLITDAIRIIDSEVEFKPLCYMTNCVHPDIIYTALMNQPSYNKKYLDRFNGVQVNTSKLPFDKLDNAKKLFSSDSVELSKSLIKLYELHKMKIFGGCCGTNGSHLNAIASSLVNYELKTN